MSKFKCDICNGDILMQANKTGVCSKCGMSYDIEAIRAMVSGKSENSNENSRSAPNIRKDELDRDSLLIYLNDLRIMETIIHESDEKVKKLKTIELNLKKSYDIESKKDPKPVPPREPIPPCKEQLSGEQKLKIVIFIVCSFTGIFSFFFGLLGVIVGMFALFIGVGNLCILIKERSESNEIYFEKFHNYLEQMERLESNKLKHERAYEIWEVGRANANKEYEKCRQEIIGNTKAIGQDIGFFKSELDSAYAANIIPLQFRNIQGVYYLYDYLSTSNQTLSEALMQCNLEAIKDKRDNVIKLQGQSIIQQAQANAALMEQNQRILSAAQATMQNTAEAAKYAQISAVNSTLSLKLQQKDLAYQRADFWLK